MKQGPGEHCNHRIIFHLFCGFFCDKKNHRYPCLHLGELGFCCGAIGAAWQWVLGYGVFHSAGGRWVQAGEEGREAKSCERQPLFITEQSGNFATTAAQMGDHFPSNKTLTL